MAIFGRFVVDFCLKFGIIPTLYSRSAGVLKFPRVCQQANDNPPIGARYSGEPHVLVSADTRQKSSFGKQGKVLNLGHLDFDIVSNFVLRISYFSHRDTLYASRFTKLPSTLVESPLQIHPFYAKQTQFTKCSNERKFCYNNEL